MAIALLERPALSAGEATPVSDLVARVEDLLAEVSSAAARSLAGLDDDALGSVVAGLARVESVAVSARMALTVEADRRRVAEQTAETGTDAWVARLTGTTRGQAAGGLWLARLLTEKYPATREAFAAGRLRPDQVRVIVDAAEQSPAEATPEQVALAEGWLVDRATGDATRSGRPMDARRLRQAARRMFVPLDHDLADRHEAILLGREARSAEHDTYLSLHDNGNGTYSGKFLIPELHGAMLTQALQRLTAPRRLTRAPDGRLVRDETAPGTANGHNVTETWGAALCELIEHLPTRGWPGHGGNNCEVIVTLDHHSLVTGLGAAGLDTGIAITAGEARRLACNAALIPAVLDTASQPLDLGRSTRLHTRTQRRAYALIHDTCAIDGCTRPFAWTEIHHVTPWSRRGPTDLDNGLPLCGHHHRRAHDAHYDLRHHPNGHWTFHRRT